jgi:hypothetical protein
LQTRERGGYGRKCSCERTWVRGAGLIMSRKGREAKKNRLPPFVALPWDILNSEAYRRLPASAAKALPYFLGRDGVKRLSYGDPARYQTAFTFSYREAQRLGFAPKTFSRVVENLFAFGFLDPHQRGGLRGKGLGESEFRLSRRWERFGRPDFQSVSWKIFLTE